MKNETEFDKNIKRNIGNHNHNLLYYDMMNVDRVACTGLSMYPCTDL